MQTETTPYLINNTCRRKTWRTSLHAIARLLYAGALVTILWNPGFAQQEYGRFYTIDNLFSRELIKAVAKDKDGYLWIATDNGVLCYDGYETTFLRQESNPYAKAFLKRRDGRFYVLHDSGVKEIVKESDSTRFRPLTLGNTVYDLALNYPKSIYEDLQGNVWIGEINAVLRLNEKGVKRFELGEPFRSISYHRTFSFVEDAFGNLWVAPFKGPLLCYDARTDVLKPAGIDYSRYLTDVCGIVNSKGDYLLIGGKEGLLKLKIDSDKNILSNEFIPDVKDISTIISTSKTEVFLGTWSNGLYRVSFEENELSIDGIDHVPVQDVLGLYLDSSNSELWVAASEDIGLFKYTPLTTLHQAGPNRIESLTIDENDHIYYSVGESISYLKGIGERTASAVLSAKDTYFARILADDDQLWIGDAFGRISRYNLNSKSFQSILSETSVSIQYVYKDKRANKWFTGLPRGLVKIDSVNELKVYGSTTLSVVVRENRQGTVFCGSSGRSSLLSTWNLERDDFDAVPLTFDFDCPVNIILHDFQFDAAGNIWLATEEGLLKADNNKGVYGTVKRIAVSGFRENEPFRSIAISDDLVCLTSSSGLVLFKNGECIVFNHLSGLPSKILKERGLLFDRHDNLLIATAKGLAYLKKSSVEFAPAGSPVFQGIKINGEPITPEDKHYLFPYKTRIEAEFISLSYPARNVVYQTKILGIDSDWSASSENRNVNILGFSEGDYTLQIRAREDGKLWSEPLSFRFTVSKPWFRTWWAIVLFSGTALIVIIASVKIHNNNLIRQKRTLQQIVDERTEEINRQKNELIEQQRKIILQKQELIEKNEAVYKSQQALNEADMNYLQLKEKQLREQIDYKNKQVTTHALNIIQKNETLKDLRAKLEEIVKKPERLSVVELRKTLRLIDESFRLDKDWDDFKLYFEQVHTGFYAKLKINYPDLTTQELRHCALIRLNLTIAECASVLGISHDSAKVSRTRLRKKLHLDPNQSLTDFILGI